ncbi:single-stranded-DNA-specific exonuclease RecJ, partial [Candidatus Parcubacteria bacterium]
MKYKWKYKKNFSADILDQLLLSRGIKEEEKEKFLSPNWDRDIYDPFLFRQMPQAINAVFKAIENDKNIVIHGDYDADGISGASLLYTTLKEIIEKSRSKAKVEVFLPDREEDGYGVAEHTVDRFITERQDLLITVDCGIANADSLDKAAAAGIDVIICDHHQLGERLPKNAIIIHPLAPKETYPNKYLCGTGVAFKLATALIAKSRERGLDFVDGWEKWLTDFVAIATVTDVMPLTGENRVLEKFGLITLNKTRRPGLRQIIALSGTELGSIDTQTIGFRIGPRLNAAGRIGKAITAFKTLTAKNQEEAERFASELEILNRERQ